MKIGLVGLGYVGLPLAIEFGKLYDTIGYDTSRERINNLLCSEDKTHEVAPEEFAQAERLQLTNILEDIRDCTVFIVTVPTPIDRYKRPDLRPLKKASADIGSLLKKGDLVVYESTVYPGATEEICVPILESVSGLKFNEDFFCGYSPERINPGDREHRLIDVKKITAGSTPKVADEVDQLYTSIISAGTFKASSIKVAEAAKVIENTQRDVNIALINELAVIFDRLAIDTDEVLRAAGTKWNFLPFRPGLVGGHCIGVDPYYLTHKAVEVGYHPEMILAGRRLNDRMGEYLAERIAKLMAQRCIQLGGAKILILGLAFKENCPDIRNSRVVDLINELKSFNCVVDVYDPWINKEDAFDEYKIAPLVEPETGYYDAIIIAVGHDLFKETGAKKIRAYGKATHVLFDIKYVFPADDVDGRF